MASYYMIAAGVLSGLVAAVFGAIDYLAIPGGTRAKRVGLLHGVGNLVVVVLFAVSWLLRGGQPRHTPTAAAFVLALLGTGWLGGELVGRLGVGVEPDANLNARLVHHENPARPKPAHRAHRRDGSPRTGLAGAVCVIGDEYGSWKTWRRLSH